MKMIFAAATALVVMGYLNGCADESDGFTLPAGDVEQGKVVFAQASCNGCHSIADIEYDPIEVPVTYLGGRESPGQVYVPLGGDTYRYRTYGELVTSVINAGHNLSHRYPRRGATTETVMPSYNEVLTVQQLIDLVSFLQSEYDVKTPRTMRSSDEKWRTKVDEETDQ